MQFRFLAFLPVAAVITFFILFSASSFVSAVERTILAEPLPAPIQVRMYESECDALFREIHDLSHEVSSCEAESVVPPPSLDAACQRSPLLCPAAMDNRVDREFKRLRDVLSERCGVSLSLMDYAWSGGEGSAGELRTCGASHDWLEAARSGEAEPSSFIF